MKPKILFILHLPPPVHGASMVGKYIHDSRLVNEAFDCHYINLTTARSLQDIGKGGVRKLWRFGRLLLHIVSTIRKEKPDLVYVTPNSWGGAFRKDFVVVEAVKMTAKKVVVHFHNKGVKKSQDHWLDNRLYRRFFRGVKVMLLAEALYEDVRKYVRREDVTVCPNGIPATASYMERNRKEEGNAVRLLFLSNLLVAKGVLVMLDALKTLREEGDNYACDMIGGETAEMDAARLQAEIRSRGLERCVTYHGRKYGDEKLPFYAQADLFVFPSLDEAFPLVVLEAMEQGLPVVASQVGGVEAEITDGDNGLLCPPGDAKALAEALHRMTADKALREEMGRKGRERFLKEFTLEAFEKRFVEGIRSFLGGISLKS